MPIIWRFTLFLDLQTPFSWFLPPLLPSLASNGPISSSNQFAISDCLRFTLPHVSMPSQRPSCFSRPSTVPQFVCTSYAPSTAVFMFFFICFTAVSTFHEPLTAFSRFFISPLQRFPPFMCPSRHSHVFFRQPFTAVTTFHEPLTAFSCFFHDPLTAILMFHVLPHSSFSFFHEPPHSSFTFSHVLPHSSFLFFHEPPPQ